MNEEDEEELNETSADASAILCISAAEALQEEGEKPPHTVADSQTGSDGVCLGDEQANRPPESSQSSIPYAMYFMLVALPSKFLDLGVNRECRRQLEHST